MEPIFEEDGPILEEVFSDEDASIEAVSVVTVYCFNCGQQNAQGTVQCSSCGVTLAQVKERKSFFSDWGTKLTEVTAIATQKTKELTQNAQVNRYLYTEKKKRDNLMSALGNAYYEKYKDQTDSDFQELLSEIRKTDIIIKGIKDAKGL